VLRVDRVEEEEPGQRGERGHGGNWRLAWPELATIAASGGMNSATADMITAARIENRQISVHESTIRSRQAPIRAK
jgi:hypothetical protein